MTAMKRDREQLVDEMLVLHCQAGNTQAMKALVDRWQRPFWRHAYRLTDDAETAWDVVQEAWVAIIRGLGRLEDAARFPTWAFRIVTNKAADAIDVKVRHRRAQQAAAEAERQARESDADEGDVTQQVMGRLGFRDRQVLTLYYLEGFGVADVARILHVPDGTAKSRLFKARARLKELFRLYKESP